MPTTLDVTEEYAKIGERAERRLSVRHVVPFVALLYV